MRTRFPVLEPEGNDQRLHAAWRLAQQKWEREDEAFFVFCTALSPAAMGVAARAMEHAETMTNEAVGLLLNELRDARQRETDRTAA